MEPTLDMNDMNSILMYCAYLRGVYPLPHRTLREFEVFMSDVIFGAHNREGPIGQKDAEELQKKWKHQLYNGKPDDMLLRFARAFLEECREQYKEPSI